MALVTIITPTTGKPGLRKLIESLRRQQVDYTHILLWDPLRDAAAAEPASYEDDVTLCIRLKEKIIRGSAAGSALRAIGLMAANTSYVTFADDDVWFDDSHLASLLHAIEGRNWAFTLRKVYSPAGEYIGVDRFESIGADSKLPYNLVDNNCTMFQRQLGVGAAPMYRETKQYNDDRLMYAFLARHGGEPGKTDIPTVNQICPERLEPFFRRHCSTS